MADDDDLDLWGDDDDNDTTHINCSANLLAELGQEESIVHKGFGDEGRLTWDAPALCAQPAAY